MEKIKAFFITLMTVLLIFPATLYAESAITVEEFELLQELQQNEEIEPQQNTSGFIAFYKAIENGVVSGYKAVENLFVSAYKIIEGRFARTSKAVNDRLTEEQNDPHNLTIP